MKNPTAERVVIGSLLALRGDLTKFPTLTPEMFSVALNGRIWAHIVDLSAEGVSPDLVTITDKFTQDDWKLAEKLGGTQYLAELLDQGVKGLDFDYYVDLIGRAYDARRLTDAANRAANDVREGADPRITIEQLVSDLQTGPRDTGAVNMVDVLLRLIEKIEKDEPPIQVETWPDVDKYLCGLRPTDLNILAARPSMGKTAFAIKIALLACAQGKRVDFWSLEMSEDQLVERMLQCVAGASGFGRSNVAKAAEAAGELSKYTNLRIFDNPMATVPAISNECRIHKPDLVIVDYLQLMDGTEESREQTVASISRGLKTQVAKQHEASVLCLAQLNRKVEERADKRPLLSDLRESGAIEQDADKIVFLYRDAYYKSDDKSKSGELKVIISKNRHGPCGTATLYYDPSCNRFDQMQWGGNDYP